MEEEKNQNFQQQSGQKTEIPLIPAPESKKKYWKFVLGFLAIMIVGFVAYPLLKKAYYYFWAQETFRSYYEWEKEFLEAKKNDTFGGQTPQETWEKFISALKQNNILDAAKYYFYDEDKVSAYQRFEKMQNEGTLSAWVNELPDWSKMRETDYWDDKGKKFVYDYIREKDERIYDEIMGNWDVFSAGTYQGDIIFELSDLSHLWKIYQL